jgi:hypothetical protein
MFKIETFIWNLKMIGLRETFRQVRRFPCRRELFFTIIAIAIALLNMATVWTDARHSAYVPCVENCGESFRVFKYVQDYQIYGAKYGFIEDYSDERNPERKPLLYTHNMSLPGILFASLEALGVHSLAGKQFVILLAHGLGLFYAFLSMRYLTGSPWLGLVFMGLMGTDYELVFGFALSPLRAWHWLALFGLLYHVGHVLRESRVVLHLIASSIFATIAFGVGYDFFTICIVISILFVLLFMPPPLKLFKKTILVVGLCIAFIIPLILRQAQIAFVLGWDYWSTDFYYTLMTKARFLQNAFPLPPETKIEEFYRQHGVFRPPTGARSAVEMLALIRDLFRSVVLPLFGALTLLVVVVVTALASVMLLWRSELSSKSLLLYANKRAMFFLVLVLLIGTILGLAIFPDHNLQIFIKHKVPLIAAPVMLAKAVAIVCLATYASQALSRKSVAMAAAAAGLLVFIVVDHVLVETDNVRAKNPYQFTWIDKVQANPDASYAVSWDPTAVAVFVNTKVTSLSGSDQLWLLDYLGQRSGQPQLHPSISRPEALASIPDYWLYFPTDAMWPFDSLDPRCRLDYLSRMVRRAIYPGRPAIVPGSNWTRPSVVKPGGFVTFGGTLNDYPFRGTYKLQIETPEGLAGEVAMNCRSQTFMGWVRTTATQPDGSYSIVVKPSDPAFGRLQTNFVYQLSHEAQPPDFELAGVIMSLPMSAPGTLKKQYPYVPVAAEGPGWIMFDLRRFN